MKNLKYEDLVMTNKEIAQVVDSHMVDMSSDQILDMISHICGEADTEYKEAEPLVKLMYIAGEMYKYGFANALYLANESVKEAIKKYGENVA